MVVAEGLCPIATIHCEQTHTQAYIGDVLNLWRLSGSERGHAQSIIGRMEEPTAIPVSPTMLMRCFRSQVDK